MNGGVIGRRNVPGVDGTGGVWSLQEIADAQRLGLWNDPYWANVSALLHMDGADGSTTFTDEKGHTFTANGNAQIDTAQSKFNGASGLFDGTGDYLDSAASADWGFGAGNWTVEAWVRPAVSSGTQGLFESRVGGAVGVGIYTHVGSNGLVLTDNSAIIAQGAALTAGVWTHIAVARSGTTVRGFRNGTLDWSVTDSRTYAASPAIRIGADTTPSAYNGHIDELRITKGVARYTTNFTPATFSFLNA
jgi:hypothetical protein